MCCVYLQIHGHLVGIVSKVHAEQPGTEKVSDEDLNEFANTVFEHLDNDKDGFVSHEEFLRSKHDEL